MKITISNVPAKEVQELIFKIFKDQHQRLALQVLFPKEIERIFENSSSHASDVQR
jgi:hypothetical protein